MTTIFIPLLFICINAKCEFMQSTGYFRVEEKCQADLDKQKQHMKDLAQKAGQGRIELIEGTCVDVNIQNFKFQAREGNQQ